MDSLKPVSDTISVLGSELTASQLYDLLSLRVDVFVVEQNCPYHELDGKDLLPSTRHLWRSDQAGITTTIRLLSDPKGVRVGRVVTRPDQRGQALSSSLIAEALNTLGPVDTVLDAQSHLAKFYNGLGYRTDGDEFMEDGIPHLPMFRPGSPG